MKNITGNLEVEIRDADGLVYYNEVLTDAKSYLKRFEMKLLPNGNYFIEISDDHTIRTYNFELFDNKLSFDQKAFTEEFKPIVVENENFIDLNFLNISGKKTSVYIFDENQDILFQERIKSDLSVHKRYDISELKSGNYTIVINNNGRRFTQSFVR